MDLPNNDNSDCVKICMSLANGLLSFPITAANIGGWWRFLLVCGMNVTGKDGMVVDKLCSPGGITGPGTKEPESYISDSVRHGLGVSLACLNFIFSAEMALAFRCSPGLCKCWNVSRERVAGSFAI